MWKKGDASYFLYIAWLLVQVFQKLLVCWDFPTEPSVYRGWSEKKNDSLDKIPCLCQTRMDKLFYAEKVIPTTTRYNQARQKSISECKTSNL